MGSKSDAFETSFLTLIFQNANIANIGDATGIRQSTAAGNLWVALCTDGSASSDASAGTAPTYTGYARKAVLRASGAGGWNVSGNAANNNSAIVFDTCTVGTNNIRYFEVYTAVSAGDRLFWGQLTADLSVSPGIAPQFAANALSVTED